MTDDRWKRTGKTEPEEARDCARLVGYGVLLSIALGIAATAVSIAAHLSSYLW